MGYSQAEGIAAEVAKGKASLRDALVWHLFSNHYPPVDPSFVPVAEAAIFAVRDEEPETPITMPNQRTKTALEIVNGLHLEAFV